MFKKIKKYQQFLESIKTDENKAVLEAVTEAFKACMESEYPTELVRDPMTNAYITTMFWTEEEQLEDKGITDLSQEAINKITEDVNKFKVSIKDIEIPETLNEEQIGHYIWLVRNHHGAGFFDRTDLEKETEDALTKAAQALGEVNLIIGDDGKLYLY